MEHKSKRRIRHLHLGLEMRTPSDIRHTQIRLWSELHSLIETFKKTSPLCKAAQAYGNRISTFEQRELLNNRPHRLSHLASQKSHHFHKEEIQLFKATQQLIVNNLN